MVPILFAFAGCAAGPPLKFYTLSEGSISSDAQPLARGGPVIEVVRVSLPSYADTEDLFVRRGNVIERSPTGRWVSRLSLLATGLLTAQLAASNPDALVTDQPQGRPVDYRIMIHISELDVSSEGQAIVAVDWQIVPRNVGKEIVWNRARFSMSGAVATDQDIVSLERALFRRVAAAIEIHPRP
jgi:hypothetical protein